ncbi:methylmalonyl Co-A mutase-associated GTPase MeaB [Heyndrickxia sporothermodurans]|uniref:methylmalonyl Co-A mutase-associated GTPase MeaB n=1 Tax=Heyndrickxia sporothermodurans TaxID=46224 RepID=UPI002E1B43C8|nr:methylmalonyl Co-A mutase-associated GTPase MeaB [Heyndrickxia sporothermodurans]MED3780811.1 methylmalonyl Co-A mutase-associated GTPase MeaB [Heyndrickxia sporothermodurans]
MMDSRRPEWSDSKHETSSYMPGIPSTHDGVHKSSKKSFQKRKNDEISVNTLVNKVLSGDRMMLAKAITLIESNASHHVSQAQQMLGQLLPHTGKSIRIGITGVPGAGKSTFIEEFGSLLCERGYRVAVLAIDPSSTISGGSILGDKTRMERLVRNNNAFIRPSPSSGTLGGVHRKTRETILACEAAGFDIIIVETVGVGQSEVIVRGMVDFFMLLTITGAGDQLQGMKKGIMELADAVVVNKADGVNKPLAEKTRREYNQILHFLMPPTKGWETKAYTCSSINGDGMEEIWDVITKFKKITEQSGVFIERRKEQAKEWMASQITERLHYTFYQHPEIKKLLPYFQQAVINGDTTVSLAVDSLFEQYFNK